MSVAPQLGHDVPALRILRPAIGHEMTIHVGEPGDIRLRIWHHYEWVVLHPHERPEVVHRLGDIYVALG